MNALIPEESGRSYYGWVVVGVVFLAQLLTFGLVYSFGVFFKPLAEEFDWSRAVIAGAFSAYAIIHNLIAPLAGRMADRYGPRLVAGIGGFCIGLAMFSMSYVTAIWQVYVLYAGVFSLGVASIYVPLMATVSRWFAQRRGLAIGIAAAGIGAGTMVFAPLAAWLILSYGWRMAYSVVGVICWVLFIPIVMFIRQAPKQSLAVGIENESDSGFTATQALKTRSFWILTAIWIFFSIAIWAMMINMPHLLTDRGLSLITSGIIVGVVGGVSIVGRIGMGFLSDRIGRKRGLLISFVLMLAALILFLACDSTGMFFLFAIIFGLGFGGGAGIMPSFPADFFGSKATASILGLMVVFAGMGVALGPFAGGRIFDLTGSYYYMVWLCIIASVVAIILSLLIKSPARQ